MTSKLKAAITATHSSLLPEMSNKCNLRNTLGDYKVFLCHSKGFPSSSPESLTGYHILVERVWCDCAAAPLYLQNDATVLAGWTVTI